MAAGWVLHPGPVLTAPPRDLRTEKAWASRKGLKEHLIVTYYTHHPLPTSQADCSFRGNGIWKFLEYRVVSRTDRRDVSRRVVCCYMGLAVPQFVSGYLPNKDPPETACREAAILKELAMIYTLAKA